MRDSFDGIEYWLGCKKEVDCSIGDYCCIGYVERLSVYS